MKYQHLFNYWSQRAQTTFFQQLITTTAATIGLGGGAISVYLYFEQQAQKNERKKDVKAEKDMDRLLRHFGQHNFTYALRMMVIYKQQLQEQMEEERKMSRLARFLHTHVWQQELLIQDSENDNWASIWLRKRALGDAEAKQIEYHRTATKASLYLVKNALERNQDRIHYFHNVLFDDFLTRRYVRMFLHVVEPMDRARCLQHKQCDWYRDRPSVYGFLRELYDIKEEHITEDDFE